MGVIMIKQIFNILLTVFVGVFFSSYYPVMAANFEDKISNSVVGGGGWHEISYEVSSVDEVENGSLKLIFANGFDLSPITSSSISVSGGDVIWGGKLIDPGDRTIVVQFSGKLNYADGIILIQIGGTDYIVNPNVVGSQLVNLEIYSSSDGTGEAIESAEAIVYITDSVEVSAAVPESLMFTVSGVNSGQVVNGVGINVDSTANLLDFGIMYGAGIKVGAHDLAVQTNAAYGYTVTIKSNHKLENGSDFISDFSGTNLHPTSWINPSGGIEGYFGYTTDDDSLGIPVNNRFLTSKWAGVSSIEEGEVMYHNGPADGVTIGQGKNRVGYRLQLTDFQPSGHYDMTITYLCVPSY